jgi:hypothetical protein
VLRLADCRRLAVLVLDCTSSPRLAQVGADRRRQGLVSIRRPILLRLRCAHRGERGSAEIGHRRPTFGPIGAWQWGNTLYTLRQYHLNGQLQNQIDAMTFERDRKTMASQ